uniref:Ring finger protein 25 n=1 Tax=Sphenodon punctatus TaxID=8508 RepID=A0A8D0H8I1_SPHPU
IFQALHLVAKAGLGAPVLYELIEKGKEILTDNNIPHGQCAICLYGFQEREAFTKTPCYHYFHSHCLARYAQHMEREIDMQRQERELHPAPPQQQAAGVQCPVCRKTLAYDLSALQAAPPPQQPMERYQPDAKALQHQEELRLIFQRQQAKGGIIDPEAEKNRYFISLQTPPAAVEVEPLAPSDNAVDAGEEECLPARPEHAGETTNVPGAPALKKEPLSMEHPGRPRLQGQGQQPSSDPLKAPPRESHRLFAGPGGARGCGWRPNRREERGQQSRGRYSQDFPRPHDRGPGAAFVEGSEPLAEGSLLAKAESDLKEGSGSRGRWTPEPGAEAKGREKESLAFSRAEPRAPARAWDCRRWEKSRGRERSNYPRVPRGRGAFRPGARREPCSLETEGGS